MILLIYIYFKFWKMQENSLLKNRQRKTYLSLWLYGDLGPEEYMGSSHQAHKTTLFASIVP